MKDETKKPGQAEPDKKPALAASGLWAKLESLFSAKDDTDAKAAAFLDKHNLHDV